MPIDVASGSVHRSFEDLYVDGVVPLIWERRYSTALIGKPPGMLGPGWTDLHAASLTRHAGGFEYVTPQGTTELLPDPEHIVERGGRIRHLGAFIEIFQLAQRYVVQHWSIDNTEVLRYCFDTSQPRPTLRLTSIERISGHALDLAWDPSFTSLLRIRQRLEGRELHLDYGGSSRLQSLVVVAPNGAQYAMARFEYDSLGRLARAEDAAGFSDRFEYDAQGRLTREVLKDGGVFHYQYDGLGRCICRRGLGHYNERRLRFLDATLITEVTNSYGAVWRYERLSNGQITRAWSPQGAVQQNFYDAESRIIAKADAHGARSEYGYDEFGNRNSVLNALGQLTQYTYNTEHQATSMTDAAGMTWSRQYDADGLLVLSTDPLGNRWTFGYGAEGLLSAVSDPVGNEKRYAYAEGVLRSITDTSGATTHLASDAFGRPTHRLGPAGESTSIEYDIMGRPTHVQLPGSRTLHATYDAAGNITSLRDPNGQVTRWGFGPCSRLLWQTDPMGQTVRFRWGTEPDRLEQVINEKGETHTFVHDDAGRVIEEQFYDGCKRTYVYDRLDRMTECTNALGQVVRIEYDALHRAVSKQGSDGEHHRFAYDSAGLIVAATSPDSAVLFKRDALGRIVQEIQDDFWVSSDYDGVGNTVATGTSTDHHVAYEFGHLGTIKHLRLTGGREFTFRHNAYGQEIQRLSPGGIAHESTYDEAGRLAVQRVGKLATAQAATQINAGELLSRSYHYDPVGSLVQVADSRSGSVQYTYDPSERVVATDRHAGHSERFEYDAAGNLTGHAMQAGTPTEQFTIGPGNQVLERGNTRFEYDAEGRRIKMIELSATAPPREWFFTWNSMDRLTSVKTPDGSTWQYRYDALARRILKSKDDGAGVTARRFLWDKDVVIQELSNGAAETSWIMDPHSFEPLASIQAGRSYSVINDHLGTPLHLVDEEGALAWSSNTLTWGQQAPGAQPRNRASCPWRFPGQWHDDETGLAYARHRYYSANEGSFISRDPIGLAGGLNSYAYAPNPINWIDPLGLAFASGRGPHEATATLWRPAPDGNSMQVVSREPYRSGNMTPAEAALGFPRSSLATHTENRAARGTALQPGDVLVLHGQYPPCSSCKGAMNRATAATPGARVVYVWRDEATGEMRRWSSINGAKCKGG